MPDPATPARPLSPLATPTATRDVLARHGLSTKKHLGQNFLVSDRVVRRIVDLAQLDARDDVLEIGPGIGTLTVALLQRAGHVTSVERDPDLVPVLAQTCAPWADRFTLLRKDALDLQPGDLPRPPAKLVANLPYAVAATVVLDCFERLTSLQSATVMVQAEVAARMAARPNTKSYGAYTVKLALHARPAGSFNVAPGNFFPPPHVRSTVLRLERVDAPAPSETLRAAALMADAAFANRRKTLLNSCRAHFAGSLDADQVARVIEQAGVDPSVRGESLDLDAFLALGRSLLNVEQR